eukprot:592962-Prorocentrum_minimum.AAC.1
MTEEDLGGVLHISDAATLAQLMAAIAHLKSASEGEEDDADVAMKDEQDDASDDGDRSSAQFVVNWVKRHTPQRMHAHLAEVIEEECIDGAPP